uniref:Putative secreted protein n=1 Tax=Ixodes ricinus TaxID=34613 RepID=A0A6B0U2D4_IXORI
MRGLWPKSPSTRTHTLLALAPLMTTPCHRQSGVTPEGFIRTSVPWATFSSATSAAAEQTVLADVRLFRISLE